MDHSVSYYRVIKCVNCRIFFPCFHWYKKTYKLLEKRQRYSRKESGTFLNAPRMMSFIHQRITSSKVAARCRLRSVDSPTMLVPSTRPSTLGDHAFRVAAARAWNSLPPDTMAASSLLSSSGDQVSSFPSVIWLTEVWRCLCWLTVKLSTWDVQHYLCFFVKCLRNCCLAMVSLKSLLFNNK